MAGTGLTVVLPYHIGVKRRFFFGFRKIAVLSHSFTQDGLEIHRPDGTQEMIMSLALRRWVVYPDYWMTKAKIEAVRGDVPANDPAPAYTPPPFVPPVGPVAQPSEQLREILNLANQPR